MASSLAVNDARPQDSSTAASRDGSVPSGFILKLYQMVNGAPDGLISWTPSGDAFKIGADLNRLESETLPQYFRHSRFQSLVRQLNFYNFRKVNRERTFWIYKHHLFHRDRPQDLHLLRRKTCPGVDGRKHRFVPGGTVPGEEPSSGFSERSKSSGTNTSRRLARLDASEEFASGSSADESSPKEPRRNRNNKRTVVHDQSAASKRFRRAVNGGFLPGEDSYTYAEEKKSDDAGRFARSFHRTSKLDSDDDSEHSPKKVARSEMMEQSLIVSEVARKLEEYAKMAMKGQTRSRVGPGGVITPPTGTSSFLSGSSHVGGLLTYDDEFPETMPRPVSSSSSGVVTDGDDSSAGEDGSVMGVCAFHNDAHSASERLLVIPPVEDSEFAKAVTAKILSSGSPDQEEYLLSFAALLGFCMTTAPNGSANLCSKVLQLITSSVRLASEFQEYRAALHPLECSTDALPSSTFATGFRKNRAVSLQQIWESATSRKDAVRDFKTFAVNYIQTALTVKPLTSDLSERDTTALQHTADVWLKSARNS